MMPATSTWAFPRSCMGKSFRVLYATAAWVTKFWSDSVFGVTSIAVAVSLLQPVELVDLPKGITHETKANHDPDRADRRKRIGTAFRSAVSSRKYGSWRKKGTVQHVEHESYY